VDSQAQDTGEVVRVRVDSLKSNADLLKFLIAVQAAIYPITTSLIPIVSALATKATNVSFETIVSNALPTLILGIGFSLTGAIFSVLAVLAISDAIHFYTKFEETSNRTFFELLQKIRTPKSVRDQLAIYGDALEADDVGYRWIRFSLLLTLWSIVDIPFSGYFILETLDVGLQISNNLLYLLLSTLIVIMTLLSVNTYAESHHKDFPTALIDFFARKRIVKKPTSKAT
jgi:hypothetical protein